MDQSTYRYGWYETPETSELRLQLSCDMVAHVARIMALKYKSDQWIREVETVKEEFKEAIGKMAGHPPVKTFPANTHFHFSVIPLSQLGNIPKSEFSQSVGIYSKMPISIAYHTDQLIEMCYMAV